MRILLVSNKGDGAWFVWLLKNREGHDVDWTIIDDKYEGSLAGLIPPPLRYQPNPAAYDLIVVDGAHVTPALGRAADEMRLESPTIGSSYLAYQLEEDRIFGLEFMQAAGIKVPAWEAFDTPAKAIAWLNKTHKRTVLKPLGDVGAEFTYVSKSDADMVQYIEKRLGGKVKEFVLQEFVAGTEVSTEAWWTGSEWVALNHTIELKKFLAGDVGPNTGCSGNVVWMPSKPNPIFQRGLEKAGELLKQTDFVGMIDLNTIVTEGEIYGLEWTPRFGYEGTCNLTRLLPMGFGEFMYKVAIGETPTLSQPHAKFAATVRLSVPPYPNAETSKKAVKVPLGGIDIDELDKFVLYDAQLVDGELMTEGNYNCIGSPIGRSETLKGAVDECMTAIKRLDIPDLQYRTDVYECIAKRYDALERQGWLRSIG